MADPANLNRRMGQTDALMLRIERSALLRSTILQVALLDGPPDADRMRTKVLKGTAQIPRFRQVPIPAGLPGRPARTWETTADFDVDYHLRFARLSGRNDPRAVLDEAARIGIQAFDPARPLWESHVINGIEDGGAAAIQKIHHSLGDGVSLLDIILLFVDIERDRPSEPPIDFDDPTPEHTSAMARITQSWASDSRAIARAAWSAPGQAARIARGPDWTCPFVARPQPLTGPAGSTGFGGVEPHHDGAITGGALRHVGGSARPVARRGQAGRREAQHCLPGRRGRRTR